jgi:hypothetical protein
MTTVTASVKHLQEWIGTWPATALTPARRAVRPDFHNGDALASYLFGILSPLPLLGLLFGVPAVVLGVRGLRHAHEHPGAGGVLQCQIGMALGGLFSAVYLAASVFLIAVLL